MMLEALKSAVSGLGVTDVEVDHDWSLRQPPTIAMGDRVLGFGEMPFHFYPTMLRWRRIDGERRLAWIEPEIDRSGPRPRLDAYAMGQRLFDLIMSDAKKPTAPRPVETPLTD